MSPPGSFSWITFLLGFAIALWLALVILFLSPDDDAPATGACPAVGCCCGGGAGTFPGDDTVWIPSGPELYTCTNNDNGGGFVQDNGGGHVQDNGGGVVQDGSPLIPAPTPDTLGGDDRDLYEFSCETNDNGGGFVQDSGNRTAVVPLERGAEFFCHRSNGEAVGLKQEGSVFHMISYNIHHQLVTFPVDIADPEPRVQAPTSGTGWVFCTVPTPGSPPQIVDGDNTCLNIAGGSCP